MRNRRRFILGLAIVTILLGSMMRLVVDSSTVHAPSDFSLSQLTSISGRMAGPFLVEGHDVGDTGSLRLQLPQCQRPIFVAASDVFVTLPEKLKARIYPTSDWDALYVYGRQTYSKFSDLPPKFVSHLRLLLLALVLHPREISDKFIFSFRVPVGCSIDRDAAVAAVDTIVAWHRSPR